MTTEALTFTNEAVIKVRGSPLEDAVMHTVTHVVVEDGPGRPTMMEIRIPDDDLTLADGNTFSIGAELEITVQAGDSSSPTSLAKGEITAIELQLEEGMRSFLVVRGYDKAHRLQRGTQTKTYVKKKISDVAQEIAGRAGLGSQVAATTKVYDHLWQANQTDWDFLQLLAARAGYVARVRGGTLHFGKPETAIGSEVEVTWGTDLIAFRMTQSAAGLVGEVTVGGWDPASKTRVQGSSTLAATATPSVNAGVAALKSTFGATTYTTATESGRDQAEARLLAESLMRRTAGAAMDADATLEGNPAVLTGTKVKVSGIGRKYAGGYFCTSSRHVFTPTDGYRTYVTMSGQEERSLLGQVPQRDPTRMPGLVPAIVTDINDPDKLGRVKVKYPWLDDSQASHWARTVQTTAGSGSGGLLLPEVNDEVLVGFEHGSFDHPYVIGGLYNGKDRPSDKAGAAVEGGKSSYRTIRSRSGHQVALLDGGSRKGIELKTASEKATLFLDEDGKLAADTSDTMAVTGVGITVDAGAGDLTLKGTNITIEAQGNVSVKAKGDVAVEGVQATVKGQAKASLEAATTEVKGTAMTQIQGSIVKIN